MSHLPIRCGGFPRLHRAVEMKLPRLYSSLVALFPPLWLEQISHIPSDVQGRGGSVHLSGDRRSVGR